MANQPSVKRTSQQRTIEGQHLVNPVTRLGGRSLPQNIPGAQIIPHTVLGTDYQTVALAVGNLGAEASSTLTATVAFSNLPSVILGAGDVISLHLHMLLSNPIAHLNISSFDIVPQTQNINGTSFVATGPTFQGSGPINVWQGAITVKVTATTAGSASGTITAKCFARLSLAGN